jgi:hypothetical protein
MNPLRALGILAVLVGLGLWMRNQRTHNMQEAIEANWKDLKKKVPADWADVIPKKRKEVGQLIDRIHATTGESRRRIRRTLHSLTA